MISSAENCWRQPPLIDGKWIAGPGPLIDVCNPATGEVIGQAPDLGVAETQAAVAAAKRGLPLWSAKPAGERSAILRRWYELILENQQDLAKILTAEQGKTLEEARGRISEKSQASVAMLLS